MKLAEIIEKYIPGDWGNEVPGNENPYQVSCIRGADIVPIENADYLEIPYRYISERSYNTRLLSVGDIIIEKSGGSPTQSTGRVSIVTEDLLKERQNIVCSNFCEAFRVKSSWNPWYVYYYFRFIYDQGVFFNFEGKTSGLKNLQMDNAFSSIEIEEYDRSIQDKVANAILNLDNKIAINHQINKKLEAMAKQLYDYWFVQFDFPDANGRPYKSSGGKMVWNETLKREIPEGWEDAPLSETLDMFDYKRVPVSSKDRIKGEYPYYGATGIMDYVNDYIFDGEYILLAEDGSTNDGFDHPIVQFIWGKTWVNNHAHILRPKRESDLHFTYYLLKNIPLKNIESGSIQKKVSQENLLKHKTLMPDSSIITRYCDLVSPFWDQYKRLTNEINILLKMREFILPLVMTGQVTIG